MKPLIIKGVALGEGAPKTIVSLMSTDVQGSLDAIEAGKNVGVDCYEWRADFCTAVHEPAKMVQDCKSLAAALPDNPLLFTFRSTSQGGQLAIPVDEYVALNKALIESELIDLVDIETWIGDEAILDLVRCAKRHRVATVISYHNFQGTPSKEWMVSLLTHMQDLGADIPKIAVMATSPHDALMLLDATDEMARLHAQGPLLTMAMGRDGSITRLAGELVGSALTFCALETASAPGQVDVVQARAMMNEFHEVLAK
jgi:3-dehydroquinate dehydratase-1